MRTLRSNNSMTTFREKITEILDDLTVLNTWLNQDGRYQEAAQVQSAIQSLDVVRSVPHFSVATWGKPPPKADAA
jgi:hypothetical protein